MSDWNAIVRVGDACEVRLTSAFGSNFYLAVVGEDGAGGTLIDREQLEILRDNINAALRANP